VIDDRRVLALIPARGGSKGLPGKHLLDAGGKPLIAWTIEAAQGSTYLDRIVLSTDDPTIAEVGRAWGCEVPFRRPGELATDTANSVDVALHALDQLPGFDLLVLLQPTSPARATADIDTAIERCQSSPGGSSCVSVCQTSQSPYLMYRMDAAANHLAPLLELPPGVTRRQDLPPVYVLNGAVYVVAADELLRRRTFVAQDTVAHVMPVERSIDIDTAEDLEAFRRSLRHLPRHASPKVPRS
jgi:CMP-N,N'-diacetyllegionaminic acid synthase